MRQRFIKGLRGWPGLVAAGLVLGYFGVIGRMQPPPSGCHVRYVYDGDTVAMICNGEERKTRLVGFDTPESKGRCPEETALARKATARMRQLVDGKAVEAQIKGFDRYGRQLAEVSVGGQALSDVMIDEGLAAPYGNWAKRPDWCARLGG